MHTEHASGADRAMLGEVLEDLSGIGREARIVPNYVRGKYRGFKLRAVRSGSLYRTIGLRSGDIVSAINGRPINSPNRAMAMFEQLKNENRVVLGVRRHGRNIKMQYTIR